MKKAWFFLLIAVMALGLCACGQSKSGKYADEEFVEDFVAGLTDRFAEVANDIKDEEFLNVAEQSEEYKEYMQKYIHCELDKIEKYLDRKFEDQDLKEAAEKYIGILQEELDATDLIPEDYFGAFAEKWNDIISRKNEVLDQFSSEFDITVPDPPSLTN